MRFVLGFIILAVGVASSQDMTGRDYFNELKAAKLSIVSAMNSSAFTTTMDQPLQR
jgi:hypothetical protein